MGRSVTRRRPRPLGESEASASSPRHSDKKAARRDAILAAALDEFAERGFAAARLDDVARRAGVAKGTIYLYFRDKEALFQDLIRSVLAPVVGTVERALDTDMPFRVFAERLIDLVAGEVLGTRRKDVIRLILSEGPRFPKLAEFYYREVLSRMLEAIRTLMARAVARGELRSDALMRFPQLLGAPVVVTILWDGLFDRFEPLDARAFMRAYFDALLGDGEAS